MSVLLDIRNPKDLISTFSKIEVQRANSNSGDGMSNIGSVDINTSTATDLSSGYTSFDDEDGDLDSHYYRFRFRNSDSTIFSTYSEVFKAGSTVLHNRFRRLMRDINANDYFFSQDDIDFYLEQAIARLWPITWMETYSDTAFVPDGNTDVFNFPVGVTLVNSLQYVNSSGQTLGNYTGWAVRGKTLIFDTAPSSGVTLRAWFEKMFTDPAEVPEIWDSHLLNLMRLQAYETMEADRSKFYKYNSIAKPEGGNLPSIDKIITRIEAQIIRREAQLRRVRRPGFIKLV